MTISLHLANTANGDYDARLPLPKPLHCGPITGRLNSRNAATDIVQVIGFTSEPDDEVVDTTWYEWVDGGPEPDDVIGTFPVVVIVGGEIATLSLPVRKVTIGGAEIR